MIGSVFCLVYECIERIILILIEVLIIKLIDNSDKMYEDKLIIIWNDVVKLF